MRPNASLAAGLLLLAAGCSSDLAIPAGARLTCTDAVACPEGLVCNRAGLCVPSDALDTTPPELVSATVEPNAARAGQELVLALEASEALAAPPLVTLGLSPPVELACAGGPTTFACSYAATGEENGGRGGIVAVDVVLQDTGGNLTERRGAASLVLDFAGPKVVFASAAPAVAGRGVELELFVTLDEPLDGPARIRSTPPLAGEPEGGFELSPVAGSLDVDFRLFHLVAGGDPSGELSFRLSGADAVGNPVVDAPLGTITIDPLLPELSDAQVTPRFAADGAVVEARFAVSKPLEGDPLVRLGDDPLACAAEGEGFLCTATVARSAGGVDVPEGPRQVTVQGRDAAGNSLFAALGVVDYDFAAPGLIAPRITPQAAGAGAAVLAVLTADEPLGEDAEVTVTGPAAVRLAPVPGTADRFSWVVPPDAAEGVYSVRVAFVDRAGNPAEHAAGTFTVDRTAPEVRGLTASPAAIDEDGTVTVTFALDADPGTGAGGVDVSLGGLPMDACDLSGSPAAISCTRAMRGDELAAGTEELQGVAVRVTDGAGNVGTAVTTVLFDFRDPGLADARVTPADAREGTVMVALLGPDEPLALPAVLAAAGLPAGAFTESAGSPNAFTLTVDGSTPEGPHAVTAVLTDRAGNVSPALAVGTFVVDRAAPRVTSVAAAPAAIDETGDVVVTYSLDAVVGPAGTVEVTLGGRAMDSCAPDAAPLTWRCTRAMRGDELPPLTEEVQGVVVRATDAAGNAGTGTASVLFDFRPPGLAFAAPPALEPDPGNQLRTVTAVGDGTTVRLAFTLDEQVQVGAPPPDDLVVAATAPSLLPFACDPPSGTSFRCAHTLAAAGQPDGPYTISVQATDLAGNRATIPLPAPVTVDLTDPAPLDLAVPGAVSLRRWPYGTDASGGIPGTILELDPAGLEAGATVIARDGVTGAELARTGGPFSAVDLGSADRLLVTVEQLDAAGNASAGVEVRDGEWIATPGYKVRGSPFENRTTLSGGPHEPAFEGPAWPELQQDELDLLDRIGGTPTLGADAAWLERPHTAPPPTLFGSATAVWDSRRQRALIFGGNASYSHEWDATTERWSENAPASGPGLRGNPGVAYDRLRDRVVLYGGTGVRFGIPHGDTWEWDPGARSWTVLSPATSPPPLKGHSLAFDRVRGKVILFGGTDNLGRVSNDSWEFDGATWTQLFPPGLLPAARSDAALAEDPTTGRLLLFGGRGAAGTLMNNSWEWDGAAGSWIRRLPATSPAARELHGLAADPARGTLVLRGGTGAGGPLADLWEWDGTALTWTQGAPVGAGPAGGPSRALVSDGHHGSVRLFTGSTEPEHWEWDGAAARWYDRRLGAGTGPGVRLGPAAAFDRRRGVVVLYGGYDGTSATGDTWEYAGGAWRQRIPAGAAPPALSAAGLAYDEDRGVMVLFGGFDASVSRRDETWEWDGAAGSWTRRFPPTPPPARDQPSMAFDPVRRKVVMFGGFDTGARADSWEWDGATGRWTDLTATAGAAPPGRRGGGLAADRDRGRLVLFGGDGLGGNLGDLWEWDGAIPRWTDRTVAGGPGTRRDPAVAYDEARRRVVVHGGYAGGLLSESWEWDGATGGWTDRTLPGAPAGPAPLLYDARRGVLVLPVLDPGSSDRGSTYERESAGRQRPVLRWDVPWSASRAAVTEITGVSATIQAGGQGWDRGTPSLLVQGVRLLGWDPALGAFRSAATSPGLGSPLLYDVTDPSQLSRLLAGPGDTLSLLVEPTEASGPGTSDGVLEPDYLELSIRYRRP